MTKKTPLLVKKSCTKKTFPFIPSKRLSDNGIQSPNQYVVKIGNQSHNISAISPLLLSNVGSPINFDLLSGLYINFGSFSFLKIELGSANHPKNTGAPLDVIFC